MTPGARLCVSPSVPRTVKEREGDTYAWLSFLYDQ